jgi:hypothetical protein
MDRREAAKDVRALALAVATATPNQTLEIRVVLVADAIVHQSDVRIVQCLCCVEHELPDAIPDQLEVS